MPTGYKSNMAFEDETSKWEHEDFPLPKKNYFSDGDTELELADG
jgi:hypothetical protein